MVNFRNRITVLTPSSIATFRQRFIRKLRSTAKKILLHSGAWRFLGAKIVGSTPSGNSLLQLNRDCALGSKGTVLELPPDHFIYWSVKNLGLFELQESKFLARGLKRACRQPHTKTVLLDIGANTGLVTLQAMNLSMTSNKVFLFEPVPRHAMAIKQNLRFLSDIYINEFALSDINGEANIFTEATNHGNTSLLSSVVPEDGMISTQIQLVETTEYCNKFLNNFDKYIIKCDTQGMDALILSRFPERIWKNCESAVIEVWALAEVSKRDVEGLLSMCQEFEYVGWHPDVKKKRKIEFNEVSEFWLSKSGSFRNLFLSQTI